jgi:hypothetical protein
MTSIQTDNVDTQHTGIQTEVVFLTGPEERSGVTTRRITMSSSDIPMQDFMSGLSIVDAYTKDGMLFILTKDRYYKTPVNKLTF